MDLRVPDRPAFLEALPEHPPLLLIDPHLELEGGPPDDLVPIVLEHPEELEVRYHESSVVEGADRHRHGTRVEGLLERLDRGATGSLDLVPFEDLTDPTADVGQQVQEGLVRFADRVAEQDADRFDPGTGADREAYGAAKAQSFGVLGPPVFGLFAKVADPDRGVALPHAAHEADARPDRDTRRREFEAVYIS